MLSFTPEINSRVLPISFASLLACPLAPLNGISPSVLQPHCSPQTLTQPVGGLLFLGILCPASSRSLLQTHVLILPRPHLPANSTSHRHVAPVVLMAVRTPSLHYALSSKISHLNMRPRRAGATHPVPSPAPDTQRAPAGTCS